MKTKTKQNPRISGNADQPEQNGQGQRTATHNVIPIPLFAELLDYVSHSRSTSDTWNVGRLLTLKENLQQQIGVVRLDQPKTTPATKSAT